MNQNPIATVTLLDRMSLTPTVNSSMLKRVEMLKRMSEREQARRREADMQAWRERYSQLMERAA